MFNMTTVFALISFVGGVSFILFAMFTMHKIEYNKATDDTYKSPLKFWALIMMSIFVSTLSFGYASTETGIKMPIVYGVAILLSMILFNVLQSFMEYNSKNSK